MTSYFLPGVRSHVKQAADEIGTKFAVRNILGLGVRPNPSDHMRGLALDFMVGSDSAKGSAVAGYAQANASKWNVTYVIWQQRIWSVGRASEGWRQMEDRGSATANHFDHVHVSFGSRAGTGTGSVGPIGLPIPGPFDETAKALSEIAKLALWWSDPNNWRRVGMFIFGLLLIVAALLGMSKGGPLPVASIAKKTIKKGVSNAKR